MPSDSRRILLLVTQADWGGVQSFLVRFAAGLKAEGHDVLLAAGGDGELFGRAAEHGIRTRRLHKLTREIGNPWRDLQAMLEIRRLIRDFKPDAIHLNSTKMGVLGSLAAAGLGPRPRIVYRIGGWVFLEPLPRWKKWFYRQAERWTARCKDVIICVHPGDQAVARQLGIRPRQALVAVPNGLSEDFETRLLPRSAARQALSLPEDAFVFGTVANAYATKNLLPYLDCLQPALAADPRRRAVIVGDGPQFADLQDKKIRLGLERLLLTGHRDDANRLYRAFDVFVLPSVKEGMPWTLLEAMASGLPIVATDVGANRWMTSSDGASAARIVPPGDMAALRSGLEALSQDKTELAARASAGPRIVAARFRWSSTYAGNRDALLGT